MPPTGSPHAMAQARQGKVDRANVIKWMQALPQPSPGAGPGDRPWGAPPRRRAVPCTGPVPVRPLPDPVLARLCAVPDSAPPYDDEALPERLPAAGDGARGIPAAVVQPARQAAAGRPPGGQAPGAQPPAGKPARPGPSPWPSQFAQVLAEALAGTRSSHQLTPWTTERARGHIRRLGPLLSASQQPRIRRVMASAPASGIMELTLVVNFGPRVRAVAVRLERAERARTGQRWLCTAIEAA